MGYQPPPPPPGPKIISSRSVYKKKFAWLPVKCIYGNRIWARSYYKKYKEQTYTFGNTIEYFENNLTEEDCVIDKLADTL